MIRPKVELLKISATDGFQLAATKYATQSKNPNVVIIASATGVKRGYYDKYAGFLAEANFTVITFDYRGIGDSRPSTLNKFQAFMHEWGEKDIAGVIDWAAAEYPIAKLFVVGHSVAGQVFGLAQNNPKIAALILVASQSGYWRLWPLFRQPLILSLWYLVIPILAILISYFPAKIFGMGESLPAGVALEWASWGRDPNYVLGKNKLSSKRNFEKFRKPLLLYTVEDDFFAPKRATKALLEFYPNAKKSRRHITPQDLNKNKIGHFGFFKQKVGSKLWPETVVWLNNF